MVLLFPFGGCGYKKNWGNEYGKSISFEILGGCDYSPYSRTQDIEFAELTLLKSLEELELQCEEWDLYYYPEGINVGNYKFNERLYQYDEAYFIEKAIVLYIVKTELDGKYSHKVDMIRVKDGTLTVNTTRFLSQGPTIDMIIPWSFIIEIKQSDIASIAEIQVIKREIKRKQGCDFWGCDLWSCVGLDKMQSC